MKRKLVSAILAFIMVIGMMPVASAYREIYTQHPNDDEWVRIQYAGNGRYVEIPESGFDYNGTQLQLSSFTPEGKNQIFHLHNTGNGWIIMSDYNGKIVEVRNSSHNDWAEVSQWDKHDLLCGRWDIIANPDNTVSFKNRESDLYMNVKGRGDTFGTKIIQYHDDETVANEFYLEYVTKNDVASATYVRSVQDSEIEWKKLTTSNKYLIINETGYEYEKRGVEYYPSPDQDDILASIEYLSPSMVSKLLLKPDYSKATWRRIDKALSGELSRTEIANLLTELGYGDVPAVGNALGVLQIISDSRSSSKWRRFVRAADVDKKGNNQGVIVSIYYDIVEESEYGPLNSRETRWGTIYHIKKEPYAKYQTWSGNNFQEFMYLPGNAKDGVWWYSYK